MSGDRAQQAACFAPSGALPARRRPGPAGTPRGAPPRLARAAGRAGLAPAPARRPARAGHRRRHRPGAGRPHRSLRAGAWPRGWSSRAPKWRRWRSRSTTPTACWPTPGAVRKPGRPTSASATACCWRRRTAASGAVATRSRPSEDAYAAAARPGRRGARRHRAGGDRDRDARPSAARTTRMEQLESWLAARPGRRAARPRDLRLGAARLDAVLRRALRRHRLARQRQHAARQALGLRAPARAPVAQLRHRAREPERPPRRDHACARPRWRRRASTAGRPTSRTRSPRWRATTRCWATSARGWSCSSAPAPTWGRSRRPSTRWSRRSTWARRAWPPATSTARWRSSGSRTSGPRPAASKCCCRAPWPAKAAAWRRAATSRPRTA